MTTEEKKAYRLALVLSFLIPIVGYGMSIAYIIKGSGSKALGTAIWATIGAMLSCVALTAVITAVQAGA